MSQKEKELARLDKRGKALQKKLSQRDAGLGSGFARLFGKSDKDLMEESLSIFQKTCLLKKELGLQTAEFEYEESDAEDLSFNAESNTFEFSKKLSRKFGAKFSFGDSD